MELRFRGASDDLVYASGDDRDPAEYHPEFSSSKNEPRMVFVVDEFYVFVFYDGYWHFSVRLREEGAEFPDDVSIRVEKAHDYSMKLVMETDRESFREVPVDMEQVSF